MYERILEMIEKDMPYSSDYISFLEEVSLVMAEEIDDMKEELTILKEKYESEHE